MGTFGDPAYGQVKHCEIHRGGREGGNVWTDCAREGRRSSFDSRGQVRCVIDGRSVYRDAWGSVNCDRISFEGDPFPNRPKRCEFQEVAWQVPGPAARTRAAGRPGGHATIGR